MPKIGPIEGSRSATTLFSPSRRSAWASPTEVVVLPSPRGVGDIAVTSTRCPSGRSSRERQVGRGSSPGVAVGVEWSAVMPRSRARSTTGVGSRPARSRCRTGRGGSCVDAQLPIVAQRNHRRGWISGARRPVEGAAAGAGGRRHTLLWCPPSTTSSTPRSAGSAAPSGPAGRDGARRRRRDRRQGPPARPGRHGHRQVARLPRARGAHAFDAGKPAVVATATLALQAQIVDRDMPRVADALAPLLGRRPTYALVKGRRNYLCVHKLEGGFPDDDAETLSVGAVDRRRRGSARRWCGCASGPRSPSRATATSSSPGSAERAWRQVSVIAARVPGQPVPARLGVLRRALPRGRPGRRRHRHQPLLHGDRRLRGASDAARARRARRRRGPRARRPGHGDDHRRADRSMVARGHEAGRMSADGPDHRGGGRAARGGPRAGTRGAAARRARLASRLALARVRDTARAVQSDLKPQPGEEPDGGRQVARAAVDEVFENA